MASIALQTASASVLRSTNDNIGVTAGLLRRVLSSEENLVATLLPTIPTVEPANQAANAPLDIRA